VNSLYLVLDAAMMSGTEYLPSGPYVRGNPFTQLPLEHDSKTHLVGREAIVTPLASQMINGTSGIHLIVGESGAGRTSLLQCLSENDTRHIGSIWPSSDPTSRFLNEALVAFTKAFKVPPTPHAAANELTNHLNALQGPLPLIAFDYNTPSSEELQILIKSLLPVLKRMRAMVVFAVTPKQMEGWDISLHQSFDRMHSLTPLNQADIRKLIDYRMHTVSNETIVTNPSELTKLESFSGGNPTVIIRQLNHFLRYVQHPEKESSPDFLSIDVSTFPEISESESPARERFSATPQTIPSPKVSRPIFPSPNPSSSVKYEDEYDAWLQGSIIDSDSAEETKPAQKTYFEPIVDSLMLDDDDSMESGVGWDDEGVHFASRGGIDDFEGDPLYLDIEDEPAQIEPFAAWEKSDNEGLEEYNSLPLHTESVSGLDDSLEINPEIESPSLIEDDLPITYTKINDPIAEPLPPPKRGGLFSVAERSKEMKAQISANLPPNPPTSQIMGIDPLPIPKIIDPNSSKKSSPSFVETFDTTSPGDKISNQLPVDAMSSRPPDITSEGADLWVEAGSESTVSNPYERNPKSDSVPNVLPQDIVRGLNSFRSPRWDPDAPLRPERLKEVSDTDIVVLTAASTRNISPSDDALQARLQVGRSRLSQIFNDLRRHGFLSVRKEGRTRWYRMTAAASRLLTEVEE
tara:strand:- start:4069 stop:6132 length:2064 start_codon:yes stop_codon:yes gene_type:complete